MKQRVIGGLVLLALIAIFLPLLFRHSATTSQRTNPAAQSSVPLTNLSGAPAPASAMTQSANQQTAALLGSADNNAADTQITSTAHQKTITFTVKKVVPATQASLTPQSTTASPAASADSSASVNTDNTTVAKAPHQAKTNLSASTVAVKAPAKVEGPTPKIAHTQAVVRKPVSHTVTHKVARVSRVEHRTPVRHRSRAVAKKWTVQLASFGEHKNALRLMRSLRRKGFKTYSVRARARGANITQVFVGPEASRWQANRIQQRLRREFKLNGIVRRNKA